MPTSARSRSRSGAWRPPRARCSRSSPRRPQSFFVAALGARRAAALLCRRPRGSRPATGDAQRCATFGGLRSAESRAGAVRDPELDGLSVLQLADIGHAQAELRHPVAARSRHVVPDRPRHLHAHVVHARGRRRWRCSACWRAGDGPAPGERLLVLWVGLGALELCCTTSATSAGSSFSSRRSSALTAIVAGARPRCSRRRSRTIPRRGPSSRCRSCLYAVYVVVGALIATVALYELGRTSASARRSAVL